LVTLPSDMERKIVLFFILTRVGDLASTTLSSGKHLIGESNVLVRKLNFGWLGLSLANALFVTLVLLAFFYVKKNALLKAELTNKVECGKSFSKYCQYIFFGKAVSLIDSLFKAKLNHRVYIYILFRTLPVVLTIVNLLIITNNILVWQGYSILSKIHPDNVIHINVLISLCIMIIAQIYFLMLRYNRIKRQ